MSEDRDFPRVGRKGQIVELRQAEVLDFGRCRRADQRDGQRVSLAVFGIELPDLKVVLEDDGLAVVADGGPQHASGGEPGYLLRLGARGQSPDILRPAAVAHEVKLAAIWHPHGPGVAAVEIDQTLVGGSGSVVAHPDLGFIQMAVPVAPPLRIAHTPRRERHRVAVRRRGRLKLVGEAIGTDGHRSASLGAHPVEVVLAPDVVGAVREVEPLAVARPGVELIQAVIESDALQISRGQREHIDIAVSRARGDEGQSLPVRRVQRPGLVGGMRDQQVRFASLGGRHPDVPTGDECDLRPRGAQRRLGQVRHAGG